MIATPDWDEPCTLIEAPGMERTGTLAELVLAATWADQADRPLYLLVSPTLGELDNFQLEDLRRRPDFPIA